jgi:hypothetical protein
MKLCKACGAPAKPNKASWPDQRAECPECDSPLDRLTLLLDVGGFDKLGFELVFGATLADTNEAQLLEMLEQVFQFGKASK